MVIYQVRDLVKLGIPYFTIQALMERLEAEGFIERENWMTCPFDGKRFKVEKLALTIPCPHCGQELPYGLYGEMLYEGVDGWSL